MTQNYFSHNGLRMCNSHTANGMQMYENGLKCWFETGPQNGVKMDKKMVIHYWKTRIFITSNGFFQTIQME